MVSGHTNFLITLNMALSQMYSGSSSPADSEPTNLTHHGFPTHVRTPPVCQWKHLPVTSWRLPEAQRGTHGLARPQNVSSYDCKVVLVTSRGPHGPDPQIPLFAGFCIHAGSRHTLCWRTRLLHLLLFLSFQSNQKNKGIGRGWLSGECRCKVRQDREWK